MAALMHLAADARNHQPERRTVQWRQRVSSWRVPPTPALPPPPLAPPRSGGGREAMARVSSLPPPEPGARRDGGGRAGVGAARRALLAATRRHRPASIKPIGVLEAVMAAAVATSSAVGTELRLPLR